MNVKRSEIVNETLATPLPMSESCLLITASYDAIRTSQ